MIDYIECKRNASNVGYTSTNILYSLENRSKENLQNMYIWLCPWPAGGALDSFLSDSHIIRDILGTVEKVRHTTYVSVKSVWQPTLLIFEDRVFLEFSLDQIIDKSRYRGLGGARH